MRHTSQKLLGSRLPSTEPWWVNTVQCGDALELLQLLPNGSINCCITSPPYWQLRNYGMEGQLGLEPSINGYLLSLGKVFQEVWRVLKPNGTCWVNLGDTFAGNKKCNSDPKPQRELHNIQLRKQTRRFPAKCLLQIPSRFAISMCDQGWILRNEIVWHKPNCMPSSAKDRFTVDFEKIFFFTKSPKYWFETQWEPYKTDVWKLQRVRETRDYFLKAPYQRNFPRRYRPEGRIKRCVWSVTTKCYSGAHAAVFPEDLMETPISAGCPEGGIVLDPFCGSGTTLLTAKRLNRQYLGIDLNPEYATLAEKRIKESISFGGDDERECHG